MNGWGLVPMGLAAYVLAALITAPATIVDAGLRSASAGRLRLVAAQGSLWSGSGRLEVRDAAGRTGVARGLAWHVLPGYLLRGQLACELAVEQATAAFPVTLSLSGLAVTNANVTLPAALLGLGIPKLAPLGLTGELALQVVSLVSDGTKLEGQASLQWLNAGSALTPVAPLGAYALEVGGDGTMIHASLSTLNGPLQLDGKGDWGSGAKPDFLLAAKVPTQYQQQLSPLLRLIAVERSAGEFELETQ